MFLTEEGTSISNFHKADRAVIDKYLTMAEELIKRVPDQYQNVDKTTLAIKMFEADAK